MRPLIAFLLAVAVLAAFSGCGEKETTVNVPSPNAAQGGPAKGGAPSTPTKGLD